MNDRASAGLWVLPLFGERKPFPFTHTPFTELFGEISPDGRWLAYHSTESGRSEVYVRPFPSGSGKWPVSTDGGVYMRWRRDGKELFYVNNVSGSPLMAVPIQTDGSTFRAGIPRVLFDTHLSAGTRHQGGRPTHLRSRRMVNGFCYQGPPAVPENLRRRRLRSSLTGQRC